MSSEHFYRQHSNSKIRLNYKKHPKGCFFFAFLFFKYLLVYQQFSPSPIGTHALDFAASSAIF